MADNGSDEGLLAGSQALLLFETIFAKEARKRYRLSGKTPRLFIHEMCWGLKCGLSGNQAPCGGNATAVVLMGNHRVGDSPATTGEILPDLSRKIYSAHYHLILNIY